jgi:hypothetical protein
MVVCVYASEVAKLIGQNPFESKNTALLAVLERSPRWRAIIARVRQELGLRTEHQMLSEANAATALQHGVEAACVANSSTQVEAAVASALTLIKKTEEIKWMGVAAVEIVNAKRNTEYVSVGEALNVIKSDPEMFALAHHRAEKKTQASMSELSPIVQSSIIKERGTRLEHAVLTTYEAVHETKVGMRNDRCMYLRTPAYIISGRVDGFDESTNTLIEVKNRRRRWTNVPEYDLIQVRVYLAILQPGGGEPAVSGKLVERFPGGDIRETRVNHCPQEWAKIDAELQKVAHCVQTMSEDIIREMCMSN